MSEKNKNWNCTSAMIIIFVNYDQPTFTITNDLQLLVMEVIHPLDMVLCMS